MMCPDRWDGCGHYLSESPCPICESNRKRGEEMDRRIEAWKARLADIARKAWRQVAGR